MVCRSLLLKLEARGWMTCQTRFLILPFCAVLPEVPFLLAPPPSALTSQNETSPELSCAQPLHPLEADAPRGAQEEERCAVFVSPGQGRFEPPRQAATAVIASSSIICRSLNRAPF